MLSLVKQNKKINIYSAMENFQFISRFICEHIICLCPVDCQLQKIALWRLYMPDMKNQFFFIFSFCQQSWPWNERKRLEPTQS